MKPALIGLIVRHTITTLGGTAIGAGIATASEWEAIAGGVVTLFGVVLSYINKRRNSK